MSKQTDERLTSAEIKKQIDEATKAAKEGQLPLTGQLAAEINASSSTPESKSTAESKPQPKAAAEEEAAQSESAELKEWAKKKGIDWTTDEKIFAALRASDQAFHAKRATEKSREQQAPQNYPTHIPQAQAPMAPQGVAPNPNYVPPAPNRAVLENIARNYNMTVEDAERIFIFNRDFFEVMIRNERQQWDKKMADIERENRKNSEFRELSTDPALRRPEVAMEFQTVLQHMQERDPQSFEQDPSVYRRVLDQALVNIARRNLEGKPLQEGIPPLAQAVTPPTTPPRPLGRASAGGMYENENAIDPQQFAKLSLDEKRKVLEGMGLMSAL